MLDDLGVADLSGARRDVVFASGFEDIADIGSSYITPQTEATRHELSDALVHGGARAHHGWLTGVAQTTPEPDGPNHRGYPTIQLHKLPSGPCATPCLIEMWVWLDASIGPGQWFSLATLSPTPSDWWAPVVTVNVGSEGWLHGWHVPTSGLGGWAFQTDVPFPLRHWVKVTMHIDYSPDRGALAVWQDGVLASAARVEGGSGRLEQVHFGLYASPDLLAGEVWNDDLTIWSVR